MGGCALALLGSPRPTIDLDFLGDDLAPSELHRQVMEAAEALKIQAEPVPLERFIPLPEGSQERQIRIGQFGSLGIYVANPYSIALSKLDRGFDTDLDDVVFLLRRSREAIELACAINRLARSLMAALAISARLDKAILLSNAELG